MEFQEWEPFYKAILADFGFDRTADERAGDWLADHVDAVELEAIGIAPDSTVAIAGAAPSLDADRPVASDADAVVAASDAGVRLASEGIVPDLIVTDLDGDPEGTLALAEQGVHVAVHAHGDNRELLEAYVPQFPRPTLLGTTQAAPVGPLHNHGGFTDGDRAAFIADAIGAERLTFLGWDFGRASGPKARKLAWAARLLHWLERRRSERFDVLDGRRELLDLSGFPDP